LETGECDFDLPEILFDLDYPGHYQRRITRVSITIVYPNPSKNDNVKCTLTMLKNSVRLTTDISQGYPRLPSPQTDPRFTDRFGAVQSIVTGNAQDDPGLFNTNITSNLSDTRYLPFEGAGTVSSWHLEMRQQNNEVDLTTVGDVLIRFYYTALYGGDTFKQTVEDALVSNQPTQGFKILSVQNDFANAWTSFFTPSAGNDQTLVLNVNNSKFPTWARSHTIAITNLSVYVLSLTGGSFVLQPQAPLPTTNITIQPPASIPNVAVGTVAVPAGTGPGTWTLKLRQSAAVDFRSLTANQIGDIILLINFQVT